MPKFARIATTPGATPQWALQQGDDLIALGDSFAAGDDPTDGLRLLKDGVSAAQIAQGQRVDAKKVQWLMPVAKPGKVICLGLNYAAHAAEGGHKTPDYPSFFLRCQTSLMAHEAPLVAPRVSDKLDYEAELAVIIGQKARHLTEANALDVVAGYACFNDGSLRDYQKRTPQWTIGKNFDATGGFGPWAVSAADLPAGAKGLKIESRLNGQVMQSDNTANMIVSVAYALHLLTEAFTLEPGDVVIMGTPSGVGYARTPPVFMKPGDRIDIEIEGVGLLSNPVVAEGA